MQIKYSYAQDKDGQILHISEATRGECYTCLGCKEPIRPRLGKIRRQHFYHPKAECSPESYLHNLAKVRICDWFNQSEEVWLDIPTHKFCKQMNTCAFFDESKCKKLFNRGTKYNLKNYYSEALLEQSYTKDGQRFVADILLKRKDNGECKDNEPMFIEIAVTHPCEDKKIASGIRIIELSITQEEDMQSIVNSSFSLAPNIHFYNIKDTETPTLPTEFERELTTAHLFPSLKPWVNRYHRCTTTPPINSLLSITFDEQWLSSVSARLKGGWHLEIISARWYEVFPKQFKSCHICRCRKDNDYYGYICLCYKKAGLNRCCSDNNPYTCGHFRPNLEQIKHNLYALEQYKERYPYLERRGSSEELLGY
ncbi:MAG: hypothetical protein Q4A61_02795 [Porphyromonadaceae bacterium]|nr:hypothetical protein [Porphyromonadaceae bacterium]